MAFDPTVHEIDPETGFMVWKQDGGSVYLHSKKIESPKGVEFPKWVVPHNDHIVRKQTPGAEDHVSSPLFSNVHVDRVTGDVRVMVEGHEEEAIALAPKASPAAPEEEKKEG